MFKIVKEPSPFSNYLIVFVSSRAVLWHSLIGGVVGRAVAAGAVTGADKGRGCTRGMGSAVAAEREDDLLVGKEGIIGLGGSGVDEGDEVVISLSMGAE